jgi:YVTN family beta-propeller protein
VSEEPEGVALHPRRDEVWITCEEDGDIFVLHSETGQRLTDFRLGGRPRTIAFSSDGKLAYIPLETSAGIAIVDAVEYRLIETVPVEAPALPMGSALSPDGRELYVSTGRGNQVVILDTFSRQVVATIPVGMRPWGIALSPDGSRLFTANGASDDVSVIDTRTRQELRRIKAGEGPWGVAIGR